MMLQEGQVALPAEHVDEWLETQVKKPKHVKRPSSREIIESLPPPGPPITTGATLMKLRALITARANAPWHSIVKMNAIFDDQPQSPFKVSMRATSEFVGQWPHDADDETLMAIAEEVVAMSAMPPPIQVPTPETQSSKANQAPNTEWAMVELADGTSLRVKVRTIIEESEESEDARLQRMMDESPDVTIYCDKPDYVAWNGFEIVLDPGENIVPKVFADVYYQSKRMNDDTPTMLLDQDARLARGMLPVPHSNDVDRAIRANIRQPKRGRSRVA